jgi:hypothetical protein
MPPARKSAAKKPTTRARKATQTVRARAATTRQATRREVEQSIARFEKRLDDASDALKTLGGHLGRGTTSSYKEMTTALTALRREASKTNKQALKDFDALRAAITQKVPAASRSKTSSRASKPSTAKASRAKTSTAKASSAKASSAKTSTAKTSTRARRTRAKKS